MINFYWIFLYYFVKIVNSSWYSSFAEKESSSNNCELGRLYRVCGEQKYDISKNYRTFIAKVKDIEVCGLLCCEDNTCGGAIFEPFTSMCYSLNCEKDSSSCRETLKKMSKIDSYTKPINYNCTFFTLVYRDNTPKHEIKRNANRNKVYHEDKENFIKGSMYASRQKDDHEAESIMDKIIYDEIKWIENTRKEKEKVENEIKKLNVMDLVKKSVVANSQEDIINQLDVENSNFLTNKAYIFKSPIFLGILCGSALLLVVLGIIGVYWGKLCKRKEKKVFKNDYCDEISQNLQNLGDE